MTDTILKTPLHIGSTLLLQLRPARWYCYLICGFVIMMFLVHINWNSHLIPSTLSPHVLAYLDSREITYASLTVETVEELDDGGKEMDNYKIRQTLLKPHRVFSINCQNTCRRSFFQAKYYLTNENVKRRTSNCGHYFRTIPSSAFYDIPLKEHVLPLAFVVKVHRQVSLLEMFLVTHFRSINSYCIHVDGMAEEIVREAVKGLVRCYNSMFPQSTFFLLQESVSIHPGHSSELEAEIRCLRALAVKNNNWKMALNMRDTDLPTTPYARFIEPIKRAYLDTKHGIITAKPVLHPNSSEDWHPFLLESRSLFTFEKRLQQHVRLVSLPAPHRLKLMTGGHGNVALKRDLVNFILFHAVALDLYNWLQDVEHPERLFYSTLATVFANNHTVIHQEPGIVLNDSIYCMRSSPRQDKFCNGKLMKEIVGPCPINMKDIKRLSSSSSNSRSSSSSNCLMLGPFDVSVDPVAAICQTLKVRQMERDEILE